jgi:hypothetical protein
MREVGRLVHRRVSSLRELVREAKDLSVTKHAAQMASIGNLSKAATVWEHLTSRILATFGDEEGREYLQEVADLPQARLYKVACAVRDGHIQGVDAALVTLREGLPIPGATSKRTKAEREPDPEPEPEPDARTLLALEVLSVAEAAASELGVDPLTWARDAAAATIVAACAA